MRSDCRLSPHPRVLRLGRHDLPLWMGLLTGILAAIGCAPTPPSSMPASQGVILISIDTLRADRLGAYGYAKPTSPFIDLLADRGVLFEQAIVQLPGTLPSHMSMFTGLYPSEHGVYPPDGVLSSQVPTLPELFQDAGFRTAGFTEGGYVDGEYGFSRGFETFHDKTAGVTTDVEVTFERGLDFLRSLEPDERFFLFLHTYTVHDPYFVTDEYRDRFWDREVPETFEPTGPNLSAVNRGDLEISVEAAEYFSALYDASIAYADDVLAGFFSSLEELGLGDKTTIILTSDHGEEFLEHGHLAHEQVYPETLRVPLIILHPGIAQARRVQSLVQTIDLAPTLLELTGLDLPRLSGSSLVPFLAGEPEPEQSQAFSEAFVRSVRTVWSRGEHGFHQLLLSSESKRPRPDHKTWIGRSVDFDTTPDTITARVRSYHKPRTLRVWVNQKLVETLSIDPDHWSEVEIPTADGRPLNRVRLESDTCDSPVDLGDSNDKRCLSFMIRGVPLHRFELYDLALDPNAETDLSSTQPDLIRQLMANLTQQSQTDDPRRSGKRELDPELVEKLRALGYLE